LVQDSWSRSKVKQYSALLINIKVTPILDIARKHQEDRVTKDVTGVTFNFTEYWFSWSRSKVADYSKLLNNIVAQVLDIAKKHQEDRATKKVAHATFNFTEGWFRKSGIYDLNKDNQLKLMNWFIDNKCNVNKKKLNKKADELLLKQQAKKHLDFNLFKEADGSDILDTN